MKLRAAPSSSRRLETRQEESPSRKLGRDSRHSTARQQYVALADSMSDNTLFLSLALRRKQSRSTAEPWRKTIRLFPSDGAADAGVDFMPPRNLDLHAGPMRTRSSAVNKAVAFGKLLRLVIGLIAIARDEIDRVGHNIIGMVGTTIDPSE